MEWQQRFADLLAGAHTTTGDELDAGAQLVATDPDGQEAFRAALARHHRIDDDDPHLIWIRPVLPGTEDPDTGMRVYNLNLCRRRSLNWISAEAAPDAVVLSLRNGQHARIEPAAGDELTELRSWDDFTLNILTAQEERDLESLEGDSWIGRFA